MSFLITSYKYTLIVTHSTYSIPSNTFMSLNKAVQTLRRCFCSKASELNHELYFSNTAIRRVPSPIRELTPLLREPSMISLAGGMPNPEIFPFKSFSFNVPSKSSIINNKDEEITLSFSNDELDKALQYSPSKGIKELYDWIKEWHFSLHNIPYNNWDLCISTGSQDLITRTFDTILDDGDTIIIEAPTYSGTLTYLKSRNINIISINIDENGMIVDELENTLKQLKQNKDIKFPKLIYIIPIGQNPSGSSYSLQRKKEIYEIICRHNLLLFEDDPYYFLDFEHMDINKKAISFQSIDIESRVIRSDSFSKILSSGLRFGYLTAHSSIIRNIELGIQSTCLHSSGLTQMTIYKLLKYWDINTLNIFLNNVVKFYYNRSILFENILNKYFNDKNNKYITWNKPKGGMFYWLNVQNIDDTELLIKQKAKNAKVLLLPGKVFYIDKRAEKCNYVRAAFSIATEQDMDQGIKRFANILVQ